MKIINKNRQEKGITLIALVVSIIVLLILAAVSIATLTGENGILTQAENAKTKTKEADATERVQVEVLGSYGTDGKVNLDSLNNNLKNNISKLTYKGNPISEDSSNRIKKLPAAVVVDDIKVVIQADGNVGIVEIPEGLAVGDPVTYEPKGKTYRWDSRFSAMTGDVALKCGKDVNGNDEAYNITSWKVLNINECGSVDLISSEPTAGEVFLQQAQGYNNAVYLLNEACSTLYGDSSKGITARSIKIEDIEEKMTDRALTNTDGTGAHDFAGAATYGEQVSNAYTGSISYPSIYAQENLSVINEITNNNGIGGSEQNTLIWASDYGARAGLIKATTSIRPYQSRWYGNNAFMQTAFENEGTVNYYSLFMPNAASTSYWVATRCVDTSSSKCYFGVCRVGGGCVTSSYLVDSTDSPTPASRDHLRPIVTLDAALLSGNHARGWTVE